jgi:hypothetical protein
MSTKLIHFCLTWNLSNNSKSMRSHKKLQLQKLFQITHSFSTIFWEFFSSLRYFPKDISISAVICVLEKFNMMAHLSVALRPVPGPPIRGRGNVNAMPRLNTMVPRTFKGPAVPTGLVRALSTVSTPPSPHPHW